MGCKKPTTSHAICWWGGVSRAEGRSGASAEADGYSRKKHQEVQTNLTRRLNHICIIELIGNVVLHFWYFFCITWTKFICAVEIHHLYSLYLQLKHILKALSIQVSLIMWEVLNDKMISLLPIPILLINEKARKW